MKKNKKDGVKEVMCYPQPPLSFIHIFHFNSYEFIMCILRIAIGNIIIVLDIIFVVLQYEIIAICSVGSHKSTVQLMIRGLVK